MTQKFLYNRVAILCCDAGAAAFFFAGAQGFAYWFGGFVLALWLGLGLFNYAEHSSLWLAQHKRAVFFRFYTALALSFFVIDQVGLQVHLWFSPLYHGWGMPVVYLLLFPLGGLVLVEALHSFPRDARLSLLIIAGTLLVALSTALLPATHLREWIYLGAPFSVFFNFIFFGLPVFVWVSSCVAAAVPLVLWRILWLSPKAK